jgi:hypothetical protein
VPQFSGRARVGPGLGRDAHALYSVKQLKTAFRAGLGPKLFFAGFNISAHARPVRFVGGPWRGPGPGRAYGPGRAELKMLRYNILNAHQVCARREGRRLEPLPPTQDEAPTSRSSPRWRWGGRGSPKSRRRSSRCR